VYLYIFCQHNLSVFSRALYTVKNNHIGTEVKPINTQHTDYRSTTTKTPGVELALYLRSGAGILKKGKAYV